MANSGERLMKIVVFVPDSHLEILKKKMFEAGAGRLGDYDSCCFQQKGLGQFRPLKGSQAFLGEIDQLEQVEEWRIEMVSTLADVSEVLKAMKQAHPYEEVAFDVIELQNHRFN